MNRDVNGLKRDCQALNVRNDKNSKKMISNANCRDKSIRQSQTEGANFQDNSKVVKPNL